MAADSTTLVLDIGKSNAKLVLIDAGGEVLASLRIANESVHDVERGYLALGVERLAAWLQRSVPELLQGRVPARISVTTHGAAFCALDAEGLLLPPIDYEWDGYGDVTAAFDASLSNFSHHGTPRLPLGLNAGRQIDYVRKRWPELAAQVRCWLPYPQYWAWWFSGVACSEVSSLGCHTGLWAPAAHTFSDWAVSSGVAARFAPMRKAWDVIGTLRPALATAWGLPAGIEVIAGVHDSNACLARHLRAHPDATVVSTGTWCVVMAPGADTARLAADREELVNVAVDGRAVATARFMGGRAFAESCGGTDPALATAEALSAALDAGWTVLPAAGDAAAYAGQPGQVLRRGEPVAQGLAAVPPALRPAVAALYCARLSALLVADLDTHATAGPSRAPVILEGPLADNAAYRLAMAADLPSRTVLRSVDELEGTARGAWMLAHWDAPGGGPEASALSRVETPGGALGQALQAQATHWHALLGGAGQAQIFNIAAGL